MQWVTQANKFIKNIQCIKKVVLRILWLFTQHMCIVLVLILIDSLILPVLKSEMHEGQHFWCFASIFHKPVVVFWVESITGQLFHVSRDPRSYDCAKISDFCLRSDTGQEAVYWYQSPKCFTDCLTLMDLYATIVHLSHKKINEKTKFAPIPLFAELHRLVFSVNLTIIITNVKKTDAIFGLDFSKIE